MTEAQLVEGSRNNKADCQHSLYQKYSPKMLGVCYRYARNRADAEDMLQEGFIRVFSQIHQYRAEGSLEAWIRKIIVHTCINVIKKNKNFDDCVDNSNAMHLHSHPDYIYSMLQSKQIIECIRLLPLGYRTVLNLYAIEGYAHKEIAAMLDIEEGSSRSQYARAKMMLEKILISRQIFHPASSGRKTAS
jgi:RNA polymerase sigma-70 factor (ECF subfamily)